MKAFNLLILCTIVILAGVFIVRYFSRSPAANLTATDMPTAASSNLKLASSAFSEGETIPVKYTCDGQEVSIPVSISGVPDGTKSLTLMLEDPDTSRGTFTHWVVFNIAPDTTEVKEGMPNTSATFGLSGKNSAGTTDYLGPCPPSGVHRYIFTLTALDATIPLESGATKEEVLHAMQGHALAEAQLMGRYGR